MTGKLDRKVAIVTGGGAGIGRATAQALAGEGAFVVVSDVDEAAGTETVALLDAAGARASFHSTDVSDDAAVGALIHDTVTAHGRLDVLHNNAGIMPMHGDITETPVDTWHKVIGIDLDSVFFGCRHAIPVMREQGGGAIVNTSSLAGIRPFEWGLHYTAAKAGVVMLSMAVAKLAVDAGVRVNAVCPTSVDTDLSTHSGGGDVIREKFGISAEEIRKSFLKPADIARAVLYLATDADFTGRALLIDRDPDTGGPVYFTAEEWKWDAIQLP